MFPYVPDNLIELPIFDPQSRRIREHNMQNCLLILVCVITPLGFVIPLSIFHPLLHSPAPGQCFLECSRPLLTLPPFWNILEHH